MNRLSPGIKEKITHVWQAYWANRPEFDKVDWLEKNVYLDRNVSPVKEGFLDLRFSPQIRAMLNDYLDPDIEFIVGMMGSQTGKSLYILLCKILQVVFEPAPAMMVYPNTTLATRVLEKRIDPMIKANQFLMDELRPCRDPITKTKVLFNRMDIYLVGAGSPTQISSDTIQYLDLDETAKMRSTNTAEKDVVGNAIARTKLLAGKGRKINIMSTPNITGDAICVEFENCDAVRNWEIQDPETGEWFSPEWENIKFSGETKDEWVKSIHIQCPSGYKITDKEKNKFLRNGRPTPRPEGIKRVAWRIPSWCSQFVRLEELAEGWFNAQGDIEKIQGFKNNECALPFEISGDNESDEPIKDRQRDYVCGEFPITEPCAVFVTADVQMDRFPFVVRAHTAKESYLIDYGEALSPDELIEMTYNMPINVEFVVVAIDTQYRKKEIIEFCKQHRTLVMPLQGSRHAVTSSAPFRTFPSERYPNGKPDIRSILVYHINRNACADTLIETIMNPDISWNIPKDLSDQYFDEMTAERRVLIETRSGYKKHEWRQTKKDNHALDCEVYQIALRSILRIQINNIGEVIKPKKIAPQEAEQKKKKTNFWSRNKSIYR